MRSNTKERSLSVDVSIFAEDGNIATIKTSLDIEIGECDDRVSDDPSEPQAFHYELISEGLIIRAIMRALKFKVKENMNLRTVILSIVEDLVEKLANELTEDNDIETNVDIVEYLITGEL
jgi:hypothetical protein